MKLLLLILPLVLSGCSAPKLSMRPQEPPPVIDEQTLRYGEATRMYHMGRYVDPNNRRLLHEQHSVYRVEADTRWNLHPGPGGFVVADMLVTSRDPASVAFPVNDALVAEINSQKAATLAIMNQTRQLSKALEQFQTALTQTKTNLQETIALRVAVAGLEKRLSLLESEQKAPIPDATNAVAAPFPPPDP